MPSLTIKDFSCVDSASIELAPITILIGPQASGKSVISKLWYFISRIVSTQYTFAEEGENYKSFCRSIAKEFSEWFPPSAWGKKEFSIIYMAGKFKCTIKRKVSTKRMLGEVEVSFSSYFRSQYDEAFKAFSNVSAKHKKLDEFDPSRFDDSWRIASSFRKTFAENVGNEYIGFQIFVPAGRSFYTNLEKAFSMIEHGSKVDQVTKNFGRLFTSLLDGDRYYHPDKPSPKVREFLQYQKSTVSELFGGEVKISRNDRHLATPDGRKIPFSVLSSGQQELLPLIMAVQHYSRILVSDRPVGSAYLLYIEEPEAHLFPKAQGDLTAHLVAVSNATQPAGRMFITTHSPYVLSTMNNLIKAASIAEKFPSSAKKVREIVPEICWLPSANVRAYALEDGKQYSIMDESGLIDGSYLDQVSGAISENFMELLGIENFHDQ